MLNQAEDCRKEWINTYEVPVPAVGYGVTGEPEETERLDELRPGKVLVIVVF